MHDSSHTRSRKIAEWDGTAVYADRVEMFGTVRYRLSLILQQPIRVDTPTMFAGTHWCDDDRRGGEAFAGGRLFTPDEYSETRK